MHKAAGAFGAIRIWSRPGIPVPFPSPSGDITILAGDWFKLGHRVIKLFAFISIYFSRFYSLSPKSFINTYCLPSDVLEIETSRREWSQTPLPRRPSYQWSWLERKHIHCRSRLVKK